MNSDLEESLFIKSIEKGFTVIDLFKTAKGPLSLTEISLLTGVGISAAQRITFTLEKLGYLHKDPRSKRYTPGVKTLGVGLTYDRLGHIKDAASIIIKNLSESVKENLFLLAQDQSNTINIVNIPDENSKTPIISPGVEFNMAYSAGGRAILSYLPAMDAISRIFSATRLIQTPKTLTDPKLIISEIEIAYSKGFSLIDGEIDLETISIGSAILDQSGAPIAAIEIIAPRKNWKWRKQREKLGSMVANAANKVTQKLR